MRLSRGLTLEPPSSLGEVLPEPSMAQTEKSSSLLPAVIHITGLNEKSVRVIQSSCWKYQAQTGLLAS